MAKPELSSIADRLFRGVMAPLVLGGEMHVGHPIGARAALALALAHERQRGVADPELFSHVELARVRAARKLIPIDHVEGPSEAEWALAAALHDLVQTTHPALPGVFRKRAPLRLLELVDATVGATPSPADVREALARHTWFARVLDVARTDTVVSWWTGSRTFLGTTPPERLAAWPEMRRVRVEKTPRPLVDLPMAGGGIDGDRFEAVMLRWLAKTPLTDLATCPRVHPAFIWTAETLGLVGTRAGRTLAARALARSPEAAVDAALGRATRRLVAAKAWQAAVVAMDLLAERALAGAAAALAKGQRVVAVTREAAPSDAGFARAAGAIVAQRKLAQTLVDYSDDERVRLMGALEPVAVSPSAAEVKAMLG